MQATLLFHEKHGEACF